jgi:two-component system NarL family sensor kinase
LHRDSEGDPHFVIIMVEDITERKEMESELAELYNRMEESREAERLHLAQELHDGPIQELYGLTYQLKIAESEPETMIKEMTSEARTTINRIVRTLRAITGELRPPALAPFGLEKAIQSHIASITESHLDLNVELDLTPDGQRLPENIRLALFRIYQSMLSNVLRHSNATKVTIRFSMHDSQAELGIEDNGEGFTMPKRRIMLARAGHLGIVGAAERAEALGGKITVESKPGSGTKIYVVIPIPEVEITEQSE